jgi:predicted ATPase
VLIGSNDSGKSSILDVIRMIGRLTSETIADSLLPEEGDRVNTIAELTWNNDEKRQIAVSVDVAAAGGRFTYSVKLRSAGPPVADEHLTMAGQALIEQPFVGTPYTALAYSRGVNRLPDVGPLLPALASSTKYRLSPRALRATSPLRARPILTSSGDNLPEALDTLITGPDRAARASLERALNAAVPTLSGVELHPLTINGAIAKEIHFTLTGTRPPVTVRPVNLSEGALLLTAFLVLAYGDSPEILLIEEPENGLHPTRLETVIDLLRSICTGAVGNRPRQVIMTTHSPLLLNYVKPEEVRIVRRDPEQGTSVTPMTAVPNLDKLLEEFAVGELWYLLTEEGLLKGEHP